MNGAQARTQKLLEQIRKTLEDCPKEVIGFANSLDDISLTTKRKYIFTIKSFLKKAGKEPKDLSISDYLNDISDYRFKEDGTEVVIGARRTRYFTLKRFSEYLYNVGIADEDYMLKVKKPKGSESETTIKKREEGFLTED